MNLSNYCSIFCWFFVIWCQIRFTVLIVYYNVFSGSYIDIIDFYVFFSIIVNLAFTFLNVIVILFSLFVIVLNVLDIYYIVICSDLVICRIGCVIGCVVFDI